MAGGPSPQDILRRLAADFVAVTRRPETSAYLIGLGAEPVASSPEQFAQFIQAELKKWARVVQTTGIKVD